MTYEVPYSVELTSELIRAARALLRWEQQHLSEASGVSLTTIKRLEARPGALAAHSSTVTALRRALESAGIEFTNGNAPGLRLRHGSVSEPRIKRVKNPASKGAAPPKRS
jgi:transcriptional regulator with XRE-family HTH domain